MSKYMYCTFLSSQIEQFNFTEGNVNEQCVTQNLQESWEVVEQLNACLVVVRPCAHSQDCEN